MQSAPPDWDNKKSAGKAALVGQLPLSQTKGETEVRKADRIHFEIDTGNHPSVALKLRRTPFALRDEVDRQMRHLGHPYCWYLRRIGRIL